MKSSATASLEAVAKALAAHPGATVAELASESSLARSTTAKLAAQLEAGGRARRDPGAREGPRRLPDHWSLAEVATEDQGRDRRGAGGPEGVSRLGRGQLGDLVIEALDTAGEASPSVLAKSLGRSAGAVGNALERLQTLGVVARTSEHPRRYRLERGAQGVEATRA